MPTNEYWPTWGIGTYPNGYNCYLCGQWVAMYQYHTCYGKPAVPTPQPGPYKCPDCNTWWVGWSHKCPTIYTGTSTITVKNDTFSYTLT